jgi:myo-inositol-1(or 4)-monophosphatase
MRKAESKKSLPDFNDFHIIAERAAGTACRICKQFAGDAGVISSVGKDLKTLADLEMNNSLLKALTTTGLPVLTEEQEHLDKEIPQRCWIIDPLDGTLNFHHGFPYAAVSICLWEDNTPVYGLVRNIFTDEVYHTDIAGAYRNGKVISVSAITAASHSILATGFPSGADYGDEALSATVKKIQYFKKVRALGSASLMLAYVAQGVFDCYYEKDIYLWDVAAGLALVKQAGGEFVYKRRPGTWQYEVLACNRHIFTEASQILLSDRT